MGTTKNEMFSPEQNQLAAWSKALGHPARIAILQHLIRINGCICGELVEEIGLAQATISQHLRELKQAGLIQGIISGPRVCYCIRPEGWKAMQEGLAGLFGSFLASTK